MPYITTKTNQTITKEQETELKELFGNAISLLPGKSEAHLMLNFEDNCRMYMAGKNDFPIVYIEVSLFKKSTAEGYAALTKQLCEDVSRVLNIGEGCTYVKYEEIENWGMNGFNF